MDLNTDTAVEPSAPLALGKPFLRGAGEARKEFLVLLRPRPRRLDGRRLVGRRIGAFSLLTRILRSIRAFTPVFAINRSGVFRRLRGRFGGHGRGSGRRTRWLGRRVGGFLPQLAQHRRRIVRRQRGRRIGRRGDFNGVRDCAVGASGANVGGNDHDVLSTCVPDAVQRDSGAPLIRDRYRLWRSRVCSAPQRNQVYADCVNLSALLRCARGHADKREELH